MKEEAEFFQKKREEAIEKICKAWNHDKSCFICGRTAKELKALGKELQIEHLVDENIGGKHKIIKSEGGSSNTYEVLNTQESEITNNFDLLCSDCNLLKNSAIRELMIYVIKQDFDTFEKIYKKFIGIIPKELLYPSILATAKNEGYEIFFETRKIKKVN
ncbi:MAG: hypothetical protein QW478_12300 [Candidatus Micrarchaeaceae archaeon]